VGRSGPKIGRSRKRKEVLTRSLEAAEKWLNHVKPHRLWTEGLKQLLDHHHEYQYDLDLDPTHPLADDILRLHKVSYSKEVLQAYKDGQVFTTDEKLFPDIGYNTETQQSNAERETMRQCRRDSIRFFFSTLFYIAEKEGYISSYKEAEAVYLEKSRPVFQRISEERRLAEEKIVRAQKAEQNQRWTLEDQRVARVMLQSFDSWSIPMRKALRELDTGTDNPVVERMVQGYLSIVASVILAAQNTPFDLSPLHELLDDIRRYTNVDISSLGSIAQKHSGDLGERDDENQVSEWHNPNFAGIL